MFTAFHELLAFLGKGLAFFYDLIPSYGLAIILLTVAVRLVMLPLTIKQTRSMQEMQKLQPEVKRLQAKYKGGDRQKMNEEMMKLYKEHKVNPLGGCLPLVLQLPIFLALYRVFAGCGQTVGKTKTCMQGFVGVKYLPNTSALYHAINTMKAGFLGMDLGKAPVAALKTGFLHGLPYFVLVLFMVATTWYQQKQIQAVSTGQQAQQMQMMGKIMPLILGVFSLQLPAGVSIYWVASNVWTIVQQRFILGKTPATAAAGPAAPSGAGPAADAAPRGGLAALLRPKPEDAPPAKPDAKPAAKPAVGSAAKPAAKPKPKPQAGGQAGAKSQPGSKSQAGAKGQANRPKLRPKTPASAAAQDAQPQDAPAGSDNSQPSTGTPKTAPATAKSNGKASPAGKPVGSGSSSRPRNTSARKRRRR